MTKTLYYECDVCGKRMDEAGGGPWVMSAPQMGIELTRTTDELEHICKACRTLAVELTGLLWIQIRDRGSRKLELVALVLGVTVPESAKPSMEDYYRGRQWIAHGMADDEAGGK